jgi:hypothetical protein
MPVKTGRPGPPRSSDIERIVAVQHPCPPGLRLDGRNPSLSADMVSLERKRVLLGTPPKAPKLKALAKNPKVALTIDDNKFPDKVLLVRGRASDNRKRSRGGSRVRAGGRAIFRAGAGQSLGCPIADYALRDGARDHYTRVGRIAGFPDPLSECLAPVKPRF